MTCIDKSQFYAAKYPKDRKWYRIKILDYDEKGVYRGVCGKLYCIIILFFFVLEKKVDAFYLDYGNKELLNIRKVRILDSRFQSDDMYAVPVSLANVTTNCLHAFYI